MSLSPLGRALGDCRTSPIEPPTVFRLFGDRPEFLGDRIVFQGGGTGWAPDINPTQVWMKDMTTACCNSFRSARTGRRRTTSPRKSRSPDGHYAAFGSFATNLDPGDPDAIGDAYLKNLDTGELTLISQTDAGTKGNGHSFFAAYQLNWKSDKAFAGSCKTLHLDLGEGVPHDANFNFTK
jgi:hypothetical protein